MKKLAAEREMLRVVSDQFGYPTWSRMIAEATAQGIGQTVRSTDRSQYCGTYHLAASGHTSWQGFAQTIINALPTNECNSTTVEPIPTSEYPTPVARPPYSVLDCTKLEQTFGLQLPDQQTSLNQVLET